MEIVSLPTFDGNTLQQLEHVLFAPVESVVDSVAIGIMLLWKQRGKSMTVLTDDIRSCFSVTSCAEITASCCCSSGRY